MNKENGTLGRTICMSSHDVERRLVNGDLVLGDQICTIAYPQSYMACVRVHFQEAWYKCFAICTHNLALDVPIEANRG